MRAEKMQSHRAVNRAPSPAGHWRRADDAPAPRWRGRRPATSRRLSGIFVAQQLDRGPRGAHQQRVGGRQFHGSGHGGHTHQPAVDRGTARGGRPRTDRRADESRRATERGGCGGPVEAEKVSTGVSKARAGAARRRYWERSRPASWRRWFWRLMPRQLGQGGGGTPRRCRNSGEPVIDARLGRCGIVFSSVTVVYPIWRQYYCAASWPAFGSGRSRTRSSIAAAADCTSRWRRFRGSSGRRIPMSISRSRTAPPAILHAPDPQPGALRYSPFRRTWSIRAKLVQDGIGARDRCSCMRWAG